MSHYWTLTHSAYVAKSHTENTAALKDWQVRTKKMAALRQLARNLEKGYIIATPAEMQERYGKLFSNQKEEKSPDKDKMILWSIETSVAIYKGRKKYAIGFCPIYMGGTARNKR